MLLTQNEESYQLTSSLITVPVIADTPEFEFWRRRQSWDQLMIVLSPSQGAYLHTAAYDDAVRLFAKRLRLTEDQTLILIDPRSCVTAGNGMLIHHGTQKSESRGCLLVDGRAVTIVDAYADVPVALFNVLPTHVSLYRRARTVLCTLLLASYFKTVS